MVMKLEIKIKGAEELRRYFKQLPERIMSSTQVHVGKILQHATERARANAPILTGELRAGLTSSVRRQGKSKISGTIKSSSPYADLMHELLGPYGSGRFKLGPISAQQPGTPEGGVGGKYIQRVFEHHLKSYRATIAHGVRKVLPKNSKAVSNANVVTSTSATGI